MSVWSSPPRQPHPIPNISDKPCAGLSKSTSRTQQQRRLIPAGPTPAPARARTWPQLTSA
eukprot:351346-Chlamydomonas_euryale.AAC.2